MNTQPNLTPSINRYKPMIDRIGVDSTDGKTSLGVMQRATPILLLLLGAGLLFTLYHVSNKVEEHV